MTDSPSLTAAEVAVLHDPDRWYEAFIAVSGDEARTPEGRRVIYARWRDELHGAAGSEAATRAKASGEGLRVIEVEGAEGVVHRVWDPASGEAALATPAPAGLDVERLISALNRLYLRSDKKWDAEPVRVFAEAIAAEYARLQPAPLTKEDQSPT